jgi:hypothetical protein
MASGAHDLMGLEVRSRDGDKLGKIAGVIDDPESGCQYLVIKRALHRDLVVPATVVDRQDEIVTMPFGSAFLDVAPRVAKRGELSSEERSRLEHFYSHRAA